MKNSYESPNTIIIKGNACIAKVFTKTIEATAKEQIKELCDMKIFRGRKIRIMPDVHAGAGCTIGTTMTIDDAIVPNLVGVDIGCGMETIKLSTKSINLEKLDKLIYEKIPCGSSVRKTPHKFSAEIDIENLICKNKVDINRAINSIGTLGGGNHFIEVDKDKNGDLYLVVHSGSRHIGNEVARIYQDSGYKKIKEKVKDETDRLIKNAKEELSGRNLENALKEIKEQNSLTISPSLAYVKGKMFEDYLHDMKIIQNYADLNRKAMVNEIMEGMGLEAIEQFTTIHNYIDTESMILRKGAVSANKGEKLLIPINMRDGSLICLGKGNIDWNCSAPHGAGRLMSRQKAKQTFSLAHYKEEMINVYTTCVNKDTIDECPMAYKDMKDILKNITPTAEVIETIKPIYNFKARE